MKLESQILRAHPFLSLIPRFTLRRLISKAPVDEYPKGTIIFHQGDRCEAIYLVISGRCESRRATGRGLEEVEEILGPGDTLGDRELLQDEPYRSTVKVVTDSILVRFDAEDLRRTFLKNPSIAGRVSQSITERLQALRESRARMAARVRRIVALLSLSPRIQGEYIAERLAGAVQELGEYDVLLVQLIPARKDAAAVDWPCLTASLKGGFCFEDEIKRNAAGFAELRLGVNGDAEQIAPLLSHLGANFDFVMIHAHPDAPASVTLECAIQSDWTYALLTPETDALYECQLLARQAASEAGHAHVWIRPLIFLEEGRAAGEFAQRLRKSGTPPHAWVRGYPGGGNSGKFERRGSFARQIRSLAREIAGCRIGLALSSGGAKGLCHIGVIQVLEEHGVEIDMIAGASMGAYVGAVWASGHNGLECERIAREVPEGRLGVFALIQPELPPRRGFLKTDRVANRLRHSIGDPHFSDLKVPLRVVATYLDTLERVVFSTGEVVPAVEASIAIPGVCVPVVLDGETFVDGGIVDPLPVDVLTESGIDRIIAVNTIPTPERLRQCLLADRNTLPAKEESSQIPGFLSRHLNYFASGNVLDTMFRSISGAQTRLAEAACCDADVVLRPIACDGRWHDFANPGKYIALGRKVAEDQIEEIEALVSSKKEAPREAVLAA
jgi:NTE family protein